MRSGKAECYGPLAIPPLSLLCVTPKRPTESLSATHLPDRARFVRDVFVCETESPSRFLKGGLCRLWLAARAENTRILTCRSWFPSSLHCHLVTEYLYFGHKTVSAHNNIIISLYLLFLYYTMLYYTILYYSILYYSILYFRGVPDTLVDDLYPYYTILYYTLLYYTLQYYTIPNTLLLNFLTT